MKTKIAWGIVIVCSISLLWIIGQDAYGKGGWIGVIKTLAMPIIFPFVVWATFELEKE